MARGGEPADERLAAGTVLDLGRRYRIERFLGAGGFAEVYQATELGIGRPVALKLLGVGPHTRGLHKRRFFREAQAAARIRHPDVVTILEHGVAPDGRPYIAQDFLDGADLAEVIDAEGPLSPRRAIPLFVRGLDALAAAHEAGVVHRDLKPANVFLDHAGTHRERLVLLDFGVAFLHEQLDDRLTATGGYLGTPRYMAPEYVEQRAVAPAMDVYQMALVLVEALSGRPVVDAANAYQSMVAHVNGRLSVPLWLEASDLGPLVRAALNLDPAKRPTADELRDGLAGIDLEALDPGRITPGVGHAETIDSGDLAVAETADSDEAGPSGTVPTMDDAWVELIPEGERPSSPPPIPYAAYLQGRPATEALSLSLFAPEAGRGAPPPPERTLVAPPPPRRRGRAWIAAVLLVLGVGAFAALDWGVADRAIMPDAGRDGVPSDSISDATGDAMPAAGEDATPRVDASRDAIVGEIEIIRRADDPQGRPRPDTRRTPPEPPRPRPVDAGAAGSTDGPPTAGDLLRWRRAVPAAP